MKSENRIVQSMGRWIGKSSKSNRGSALLVVLGMLSFMLFSGLAFSVYMRQSRLPTSFLRRTVATRQLAKAALAEAIEEIDTAIGNDPHPNVYQSGSVSNIWDHRVFIGMGTTTQQKGNNEPANAQNTYPALVDPSATVPTLTLEGLAYLPPNLINEARYYSQRTPTAKWNTFKFDSGRYAYTAIDVSDYFDVNRIFANKPRAACGSRRISFAHLFEEGADHASAGSQAATWDQWMEEYREVDSDTDEITFKDLPFVSLADFNIAFGATRCGIKNPFYNFISDGNPYEGAGQNADDATAEKYRNMTFVTDGWFPKRSKNNDGKVIYACLDDPKYQPFKMANLEQDDFRPSIDDIGTYTYSDPGMQTWAVDAGGGGGLRLNHLNFAALWDYLDADSVPVSLCIPTVERTPMICGIRPSVSGDIEISLTQDKAADTLVASKQMIDSDAWDLYSREVTYTLDLSKLTAAFQDVRVLLTYPFRDLGYTSPNVDTSWTLDGRFSAFLTTAAGGDISTRVSENGFSSSPKRDELSKCEITDKSLASFPLKGAGAVSAATFKGKGTDDSGLYCVQNQLRFQSGTPSASGLALLKVTYTWARDRYPRDSEGKPDTSQQPVKNVNPDPVAGVAGFTVDSATEANFYPLDSSGKRVDMKSLLSGKLSSAIKLKLNFAVWLRLANADGDAVDYVPACSADDININKGKLSKCARNCGGAGDVPLMRVIGEDVNAGLELSLANLASTSPKLGTVKFPDVKWLVADPRYNHAPENWVQIKDGGALEARDWQDNDEIKKMVTDRDGDMFMATSDAGYMQSIYELAFLPRVSNGFTDDAREDAFIGTLPTTFDGKFRDRHADAKDAAFMWKTYSPYRRYSVDEFSELKTIMEPDGGTKVNPYSDDTKVLMAAFANTPHDWRVAATNDTTLFDMKGAVFNKKHAWNAYSTTAGGKMCWDCLEAFAEKFHGAMASASSFDDFDDLYASLGWSAESKKILASMKDLDSDDGDNGKLYSVDKKFLYGFWHDCFAVRQQLFLIFVRAEPMMMGGGLAGKTPPQLSARAVALVWRDPTSTKARSTSGSGSSTSSGSLANPHRTRILFYHQFD